jgi:hypothetical protein
MQTRKRVRRSDQPKPKTRLAQNPWDRPPLPKRGDRSAKVIHTAVGEALLALGTDGRIPVWIVRHQGL